MKKTLGSIQINDSKRKFRIHKGFLSNTKWIPFNDLLNYEVRKQTADVGKKRLAIMGTNSASGTVTTAAEIHVDIDNLRVPYVTIPIMKKRLRGRKYEKAERKLNDTLSGLQYIERNQTKQYTGRVAKEERL